MIIFTINYSSDDLPDLLYFLFWKAKLYIFFTKLLLLFNDLLFAFPWLINWPVKHYKITEKSQLSKAQDIIFRSLTLTRQEFISQHNDLLTNCFRCDT